MDRAREVVDLTSSTTRQNPIALSSSPPFPSHASSSQFAQDSERARKRQRQHENHRYPPSSPDIFLGAEAIETIDMTEDPDANELAKAVARQREDAIKAQQPTETSDRPLNPLMAYKCPICMDTPVDATTTSCGHLFCHKCIVDCLTFTPETRGDSSKQSKGTCPVCRKPLSHKESSKKQSLIPIQYKIHTKTRSELEAIRKKKQEEEEKEGEQEDEQEDEE
ncbi:hypothetical protein N7541_001448 [Penicillium brevicompactum]|uniref:RING-type domain-containing protein n=1 Tax=Penicillium brevicompactum TaxID=5074 RepID=A0A9W9RW24_PENBR|nr:hypothetical protein N7541_001448 [Penicillium brevicompactum]